MYSTSVLCHDFYIFSCHGYGTCWRWPRLSCGRPQEADGRTDTRSGESHRLRGGEGGVAGIGRGCRYSFSLPLYIYLSLSSSSSFPSSPHSLPPSLPYSLLPLPSPPSLPPSLPPSSPLPPHFVSLVSVFRLSPILLTKRVKIERKGYIPHIMFPS